MNAETISLSELGAESARRATEGWRLVTATCVPLKDGDIDLIYHFDRDLVMEQVRLTVARDAELPSLNPDHPGAYLVENEIQDQFGLRFSGLTPDFGGQMFLEPEARLSPMAAYTVVPKKEEA
ncbi:NADH-quinone oxidoreductase subunit C [Pseudodesulfovibrio sediminis]|uniref:Ech hydrogenase subunit EchD n=1 Tax=Pseudodesulfovibrio sediminis TaxID=2810563 RepID=A0ABM7PA01_9BACT|nr:NADH-quinone oxidoreductase subunit C [Pseudodesulfovibrio sediminis]BCS89918.1 ech hydrogenase subunit EchD [Pseudodesulfovibrio sediminis]